LDRTHGIVTETFALQLSDSETISIQLWDFGGQEIYHATHRCFLHQGALYLLLWSEDDEAPPSESETAPQAQEPIPYWLHWIKHLAPHSPIVLVKNKIDQSNRRLLPAGINGQENPFADLCSISAKLGIGVTERLLPVLRAQVENLRHRWGYLLPRTWLAARGELERLRSAGALSIDGGHFGRLCQQCNVDAAATLLRYLHDTGFLYCRLGVYADLVILDQNWFIRAVYTLLDPRPVLDEHKRLRTSPRERIKKQRGEFSGTDVRDFWSEYTDADCRTLLGFMKQVALAFELSETESWVTSATIPDGIRRDSEHAR
jgi:internalin A